MGLITKIKDILFEEEELTEQIDLKDEQIAKKVERPLPKEEKKEVRKEEPVKVEKKEDEYTPFDEQDVFINDSFPFADFDEEEFSKSINKEVKPAVSEEKPLRETRTMRTTNVLDYERNKKQEKRNETNRYELKEKETVERKKFKPSPIISPVYGILHEDYSIEDIKHRHEVDDDINFDEVRKKAFEITETPKRKKVSEDTITVRIEEPEEEKFKKGKTIDDLLEEHSDEVIDVAPRHNKKEDIKYDEIEKLEQELDNIEEDIKPVKEDIKDIDDDDTLENDLFDLIDSMYENREDGDY